jgi:hypothetical protein
MQYSNEFTINRPTCDIIRLFDGKSFTYQATSPSWKLTYIRNATFNTEAQAKKAMNAFEGAFDKAAKRLEASGRRKSIMKGECDNGKFYHRESQVPELTNIRY